MTRQRRPAATPASRATPGPGEDVLKIYQIVAAIPEGRVASYGQVAALAGYPGRARWVGWVLSQIPASSQLPWHRVINSSGQITCPGVSEARDRLIAEGVTVRQKRVSFRHYGWQP